MDLSRLELDVDPITISYEGGAADLGGLDMADLAKSLDGYARILGTIASFAVTYEYHKHLDTMPVRARVVSAQVGSLELGAVLDAVAQTSLVTIRDAIGLMLEYVFARLKGKEEQVNELREPLMRVLDIIDKQVDARDATITQLVDGLVPSARKAVAPIGESCQRTLVRVGNREVAVLDEHDKQVILSKEKPVIQPEQTYRVWITELDISAGTAKVSFASDEDYRCRARISDPLVRQPNSAYALAIASQQPVDVRAKAEIVDGQIAMLHISDAQIPTFD